MLYLGLGLAAAPCYGQSEARAEQLLFPGDAVRITVWEEDELSGEYIVTEDGTINHPLYRHVEVGGQTLRIARERVREFLLRFEQHPEFVIEPLLRISIGGEIMRPDLYRFPPHTTVAEAVAQAGGVTERGDLRNARLMRAGEEHVIDLTTPNRGLAASPISSGDHVQVYPRRNVVRDYIAPLSSVLSFGLTLYNVLFN